MRGIPCCILFSALAISARNLSTSLDMDKRFFSTPRICSTCLTFVPFSYSNVVLHSNMGKKILRNYHYINNIFHYIYNDEKWNFSAPKMIIRHINDLKGTEYRKIALSNTTTKTTTTTKPLPNKLSSLICIKKLTINSYKGQTNCSTSLDSWKRLIFIVVVLSS